ncbi:MAG: YetF domain-containing protein [Atopobiaceae bacterium]|jgi:uncharacterized membrane protein YcaP (DUF421 family)|nr:DUF421 domain-containing protein [Atopobiaceae bacterium]
MEIVQQYAPIVGSTAAVYVFVVVALRLFGKTEIAQLSVIDLVFVLLISNAVQNAMVGSDSSLAGGLVAATTLFVMNLLFKRCLYRIPWFSKLLQGSAVVLVRRGRVVEDSLRRAMLTRDELMEALREHGVERIGDVDLAILEVDGNISVLSEQFRTTTRRPKPAKRETKKRQ